jgi:hypothetical protein
VIFHWNNNAIRVPMIHDSGTLDMRSSDSYLIITQLDVPDQPWAEEPLEFEVIPMSKNEKRKERKRQQKEREKG